MRNLKRLLFAVFILLLVLAFLVFVLENQQMVTLLFLGWSGSEIPISLVMVLTLLIGMVIGPIVSWILRCTRSGSRKRLL